MNEAMKQALEKIANVNAMDYEYQRWAREALAIAELESQEPVAWKLMPRDATDAMLKAMDECSTEGYDERLYAGHAASVYMAAWDASDTHPPQRTEQNFCPRCGKRTNDIHTCTPPQRTWVGLTNEEVKDIVWNLPYEPSQEHIRAIEAKLKERNS